MGLKKYIFQYILTALLVLPLTLHVAKAQEGSFSSGYNLLKAVKDKDYGKVRSYLQKGANANTRDYESGATPLYLAASMKDSVSVTFLLNAQANPDLTIKSSGETALMAAVRLKAREVVDLLIKQNADLNIKDRNGETALHKAVLTNDREIVKALLEGNADWSLADNTGRTPMDLSKENRRLRSMIRILESAGAEY
jgi:uncharacterized protein|tara:strand:+ start:153603 stop:154190 length:588 start_codon:yes stop_codon:yes gene_type:complete